MTIDAIDIPVVVGLALVVGFAAAHLHYYYQHRFDWLYINEVTCPKCGARPNKGCVGQPFGGQRWPYTCMERWEKVDAENNLRDLRCGQANRARRK